jgi:hypothetical protein
MSEPMVFFFGFCGLQFLWFQNFGNFFLFEASFSNFHKRKEYPIFFPNKFLATQQKITPKMNHWPKPLFSGSSYHSDNGTSNAISDQVPYKKNPNMALFGNRVQFYLEHSSRLEEYWRLGSIGVV